MGFLLSELFGLMEDTLNGATQPKLALFSVLKNNKLLFHCFRDMTALWKQL